MIRFLGALRKEWSILGGDPAGLILIFLMPVLLVLVVTLAQERALKNQIERTSLYLSAPDHSALADVLRPDLTGSGFFTLSGEKPSPREVILAIEKGDFPIGIIIGEDDTTITIVADPAMHEAYKATLVQTLRFLIRGSQGKHLMQQYLENFVPVNTYNPDTWLNQLPEIRLQYAVRQASTIQPTPVQNNVPGFILFAMFFIVIPLSGSLIQEKNEGTFLRLRTAPSAFWPMISAKVLLYELVCIIQFLLMLAISLLIFNRLLGFPALQLGSSPAALTLATLTAGLAATGFGLLVGTFATTHSQAALAGSVLVVLLGIISGTFLPVHVMPETIRIISSLSPIRWGIDNYLDIFIRDGSLSDILPRAGWLFLFFIFALLLSVAMFVKKGQTSRG